MKSTPELLRLQNIGRDFKSGINCHTVLNNINLAVSAGESLAVVGPSGCGKTTLLMLMSGLLTPTRGKVILEGGIQQGSDRRIALVQQDYGLLPWKTVAQNILLGARLQRITVDADNMNSLKAELGITDLDRLYPEQLSGGQRQRVALARALLLQPQLLLLDEPFAALDAITRERLQDLLRKLHHQRGFGLVIVTHDVREAALLGQRVLVLEGKGAGIHAIVSNTACDRANFRSMPEYFKQSVALRAMIGDAA